MTDIELDYYMFDWDDNIVFMPTLIHMECDGKPVNVTTAEFTRCRKAPNYRPLDGDWDKAFSSFRDPPQGDGDFVGDTRAAIAGRRFAPSHTAFKMALMEAAIFAIVTARGHSAATIRQGVETFIAEALTAEERSRMIDNIQKFNRLAEIDIPDDECLGPYLDLNAYVGVSSPGFLRNFEADGPEGGVGASPEEAKCYAVDKFIETTLGLTKNLKHAKISNISFGFSDDDRGNYAEMREFLKVEMAIKCAHCDFFMYDTSGNKMRTEVIHE